MAAAKKILKKVTKKKRVGTRGSSKRTRAAIEKKPKPAKKKVVKKKVVKKKVVKKKVVKKKAATKKKATSTKKKTNKKRNVKKSPTYSAKVKAILKQVESFTESQISELADAIKDYKKTRAQKLRDSIKASIKALKIPRKK